MPPAPGLAAPSARWMPVPQAGWPSPPTRGFGPLLVPGLDGAPATQPLGWSRQTVSVAGVPQGVGAIGKLSDG